MQIEAKYRFQRNSLLIFFLSDHTGKRIPLKGQQPHFNKRLLLVKKMYGQPSPKAKLLSMSTREHITNYAHSL